jgi:H+/Cl- antiporter ClcA
VIVGIAGALLVWALAIKAVLDDKVVWRSGATWRREDDPRRFWRFVIFLVVAGFVLVAFVVLTRNVPAKHR